MTRKHTRWAATALAAATLAVAIGQSASAANGTTVISLVSITTSDAFLDKPPKGPSVGDTETSSSRLLNAVKQFGKAKGAVVGKDQGTIRVVGGATAVAKITTRLPGGTLQLAGHIEIRSDGTILIPVVSGTGRFVGALGMLLVTPLKAKGQALNEYRISLSGAI